MNRFESAIDLIRSEWTTASPPQREEILLALKQQGLSIIEVITALRSAGVFSLGDAKEFVSASSAWRQQALNAEALHEDARKVLREFSQ